MPRNPIRYGRLIYMGASLAAVALAAPALAQADEEQQARDRGIEEIVVTATRNATNLQDTPLAITAVTAETMEARAFTNIQDVAAIVPNAAFTTANAPFGRAVQAYIRGIGQADFNLAFEPGVAFYVDDQYYALLAGSTFDLMDLERVEVLRGPQGTVFGRNAIGGAVNLVAKAPSADPSGYVEATYGSYNRLALRAGFNMPLSDKLFLRVTGISKTGRGFQKLLDFRCTMAQRGTPELAGRLPSVDPSDGQSTGASQSDCVLGRYGGDDIAAVRGALRYAGDGIDVTVTGDYTDDQSPVVANSQIRIVPNAASRQLDQRVFQPLWGISYDERFLPANRFETYATHCDPIAAGTVIPGTYYNGSSDRGGQCFERKAVIKNYGFSGKAIVDLNSNLTLTMLGGYRNVYTTGLNDQDGSPVSIQNTKSIITHEQWTFEPRLNYKSSFLDLTAGLFYYNGDGLTTSNVSIPLQNLQQNARISVKSESKAAYGQAQVRPLDGLQVTAGLRYSDDRKDTLFNNGQGGIVRDLNAAAARWDYRFGLDYQVTSDIMVYGSVASGYRPGAYNPRPFQPSQLEAVDAEELVAYEIGFKSDFFDRRLRVNVAGFYSDYKSRIVGQSGSECLNNGTRGQCNVAGVSVDPWVTGGREICRDYVPATDGPVNLARGIGVSCTSRTNNTNSPGKIRGAEIELQAKPIDGLLIDFSGGYTSFDAPELRNDPLVVNQTPSYVPEWTGSFGAQYDIEIEGLAGTVTPRFDAYYQSKVSFNSRSNFAQIPGRAIFNGRLTYQTLDRDWTLAFGVTNLFNKMYYVNIFDRIPNGQPNTEGQPGRPREFYLTARKSF